LLTVYMVVSFAFLLRLGYFSLIAGSLFAVHPVISEAVCCISFMEDVLIGFFITSMILSLISSYKTHSHDFYYSVMAGVSFFLALFSKESAIAGFLLVLLTYRFVLSGGCDKFSSGFCWSKLWRQICMMTFILFFYLLIRFVVFPGVVKAGNQWVNYSFWRAILQSMVIGKDYFLRLLFPVKVLLIYPNLPLNINSIGFCVSVFLHIIMILLLLFSWKKVPSIAMGIGWFYISFLPVSNIFPLWTYEANRFMYLPSIGFVIIFSGIMQYIWHGRLLCKTIIVLFSMFFIGWYSIATRCRVDDWRDNSTLWAGELKRQPDNFFVLGENAILANFFGKYKEAENFAMKALGINPDYDPARFSLAKSKLMQGSYQEAFAHYRVVTSRFSLQRHLMCDALFDMACLWDYYGLPYLAEKEYKKALIIDTGYLPAIFNLGQLLFRQKRYKDALEIWESGRMEHPENQDLEYNVRLIKEKFNF